MTDINALINAEDDKRQSKEQEEAAQIKAAAEAGGMTSDELTQFLDPDYQTQAKMLHIGKSQWWKKQKNLSHQQAAELYACLPVAMNYAE